MFSLWRMSMVDTISIVPSTTLDLPIATRLTAAGFAVPVSDALARDVHAHLRAGELWTVMQDTTSVGYAIVRRYFADTLYIVGIMLMPQWRGQRVCERVVAATRQPTDQFLALRTASPIMWAAGNRICNGAWLPNPRSLNEQELVERGMRLAREIGCSGFPHSPGFYGSPLYGVEPRHRDADTQAWWATQCDYQRADAVVCIGRLP